MSERRVTNRTLRAVPVSLPVRARVCTTARVSYAHSNNRLRLVNGIWR